MSKTAVRKFAAAFAIAAASVVGAAGSASAMGPGMPGTNNILPGGNIVQIAQAANRALGEFDYLLAAVGCLTDPSTGANPIVQALTGDERLTLFAPTDEAFENLQRALGAATPSPQLTCSLGAAVVADVLTYHVTEGRRFANSVFNANRPKNVAMLNGEFIRANPDLTLTDIAGQSVGVVGPLSNIDAANGVIHVIDKVLLPFKP
jgi:transforming growth factor-beta-induced protein